MQAKNIENIQNIEKSRICISFFPKNSYNNHVCNYGEME